MRANAQPHGGSRVRGMRLQTKPIWFGPWFLGESLPFPPARTAVPFDDDWVVNVPPETTADRGRIALSRRAGLLPEEDATRSVLTLRRSRCRVLGRSQPVQRDRIRRIWDETSDVPAGPQFDEPTTQRAGVPPPQSLRRKPVEENPNHAMNTVDDELFRKQQEVRLLGHHSPW